MKRFITLAALLLAAATPVRAEVAEITVAQQYGVSFLPMMLMEQAGLVEKAATLLIAFVMVEM